MAQPHSLYRRLLEAGCEMSNHASDLYVKADAKAARIIEAYEHEIGRGTGRASFTNAITSEAWWDIPFMFEPWWLRRAEADRKLRAMKDKR